jgi:hypothetical protein
MAPEEFRPISVFDSDKGTLMRMAALAMTPDERKAIGGVQSHIFDACGPWIREGVHVTHCNPDKPMESCVNWAEDNSMKPKLMVWDTVATTARHFLHESKNSTGLKHLTRTINGRDYNQAGEADYGLAQGWVLDIMRILDARDCHVLLISHERTSEIKKRKQDKNEQGRIIVGPRVIGSAMTEELPTIMDPCLRFEPKSEFKDGKIRNYVAVRSADHEGMYLAGDRGGLFQDESELDPIELWKKIGALVKLAGG